MKLTILSEKIRAKIKPLVEHKEMGIGYWITDLGKVLPVPVGEVHSDVAADYMVGEKFNSINEIDDLPEDQADLFYKDINQFALVNGWTRLRFSPKDGKYIAYADLGVGNEEEHKITITRIINAVKLPILAYKYATADTTGYIDA